MNLKKQVGRTSTGCVALAASLILLSAAPEARVLAQGQPGALTQVYEIREPARTVYAFTRPAGDLNRQYGRADWIAGRAAGQEGPEVWVGSQLVLHTRPGTDLRPLIQGEPLEVLRLFSPNVYVLAAPHPWMALEQSDRLGRLPQVQACYPVMRKRAELQSGDYAPAPKDPYFPEQWHLQHRTSEGVSAGVDLNARGAWGATRGEGVTIAVVDTGVETQHPDLVERTTSAPHFNFELGTPNGDPSTPNASHATAVAGLAAASGGNQLGVVGVSPEAQLASWVIFNGNSLAVDNVTLADMFRYQADRVAVQNHSWTFGGLFLARPSLVEEVAIQEATEQGRGAKGVVIVRSAGNARRRHGDANADGYASSPRVIAVGAVRGDGRVTRYSSRGTCLLLAGPSAESKEDGTRDLAFPTLTTTDRTGSAGYNVADPPDRWDYTFGANGFTGTSGSAPQVAGIAALLLSARPDLGYRDIQHLLALSSRHVDLLDPVMVTNAAGFRVSPNVGFGVPDAGFATRLAFGWPLRPGLSRVSEDRPGAEAIPDDGYRVEVVGTDVPFELQSIPAYPGLGAVVDGALPFAPVVDVGDALEVPQRPLASTLPIIRRGFSGLTAQLSTVAAAGAPAAIVYNNSGGQSRIQFADTAFAPIPMAFISENDGTAVLNYLEAHPDASARIRLLKVTRTFPVETALILEHVGLTVATDHPRRGDLRITLVSPRGTRSVLQEPNEDASAGPSGWTYVSTHHFFESSVGTWTAEISDLGPGHTGNVLGVTLELYGVPITDSDRDGLDDSWELNHFASLHPAPSEDSDLDGYNNSFEQLRQTDPTRPDEPLRLDISKLDEKFLRLAWPSSASQTYQVWSSAELASQFLPIVQIEGRFPETEFLVPLDFAGDRLFQIRPMFSPAPAR